MIPVGEGTIMIPFRLLIHASYVKLTGGSRLPCEALSFRTRKGKVFRQPSANAG
jgi:hypothetical protein